MAAVQYKNKQWDVDGEGVACIIRPGIPTATTTQVPKESMEREIAGVVERLARVTARRDQCQTEVDALTATKAALDALVATVTAEP